MTPGEKISALRTARHLTQDELVDAVNRFARGSATITRYQVANWETDRHLPEWPAAKVMVRYFKITLDDLFFDERIDFLPKPIKKTKRSEALKNVR